MCTIEKMKLREILFITVLRKFSDNCSIYGSIKKVVETLFKKCNNSTEKFVILNLKNDLRKIKNGIIFNPQNLYKFQSLE